MALRHAPDELLLAYASGALSEPMALAVAAHLTLDPVSRARVAVFEALGGGLLEELEPAELASDALAATLVRLDLRASVAAGRISAVVTARDGHALPRPLRDYVGPDLAALPWRRLLPGVAEAPLAAGTGGRARLLRIAPRRAVPQHSHHGREVTLVLEGAYRDSDGSRYGRGDLQFADGAVDHQPRAEGAEPCLCLAVTDAPLRFTGRFGRLLNPFVSYA